MKIKTHLWDGLILFLVAAFLILPLALTFFYSVFTEWMDILPTGFTLSFYAGIFSDGAFINSLLRSIVISIVPVVICTIAILLVLYVITLYVPKLEKYIEILCNIPYAIQGVILAAGIISLYSGKLGFLSNRIFLLVGAYCIIILPYVFRGLKNMIGALNVRCVIEAAQVLGCSKLHAFFTIVIPQMKRGIISTMMLAFTMIFADFVVVNMIAGSAFRTAGIYLYQTMSKSGQTSSAIIVILFITTLLISTLTLMIQNKAIKSTKGRKA
ncbi:ABC transporter permease subunit [Faecalicoccus pleomorphus]|uniref:ABC transporter permease subunit n=1 Tax=Faecalicoccus pleomorphus TaxID=1323 RepID=A0A3E3E4S6_9FIRM|nr:MULTISPECIES: ABC transporter permease subunit [Faecalicoccus]MDY5110119.1 ABC transporter permease subunit [Faecalicoccus sp.]RGD76586.1 ABC transporter permease subunit [Faecalicoccus pleomorphus]